MKINLPVTGIETRFPDRYNILSTTDLKGAVTYVNDDFCKVAGFSTDELLHKNHNTIRHPDMPPAAFKNLWDFLKVDHSWMGIVKNRCKSGNHYWVDAYVMPIKEQDKTVEYQSVRFAPSADQVTRAEQVYSELQKGKQPKLLQWRYLPLWLRLLTATLLGFTPLIASVFGGSDNYPDIGGLRLIALIASLLLTAVLLRGQLRRLHQLVDRSRKIYDNPLMQYVYTGAADEVAQIELALKMRQSELRSVVGRVRDSSDQIQGSALEAKTLMQQVAEGAEQQQHEIHQIASAMDEMSASFREVAGNCEESSQQASEVQQRVEEFRGINQDINAANDLLLRELNASSQIMARLTQQSQAIGSVLDVIKSIAEQTNLLALNAAIEAARAGEQGRGFAVVADEVRALAKRTQESTEEIETMITKLRDSAQETDHSLKNSSQYAEHGLAHLAHSNHSLDAITQAVKVIADMSLQIAAASEEQSCVANDISKNVTHISDKADHSTELSAQALAIAEKFARQAARQQALTEQFLR